MNKKPPPDMSESSQQGWDHKSEEQFLNAKKTNTPSVNSAKEKQALQLIKQGKLNEAEQIYRELITTGSASHIAYGNLGVLLKTKGDTGCYYGALKMPKTQD